MKSIQSQIEDALLFRRESFESNVYGKVREIYDDLVEPRFQPAQNLPQDLPSNFNLTFPDKNIKQIDDNN